ncbi:MAG: branched-chain amino acid ABC transporter permease, partial [Acidimicrobiia bacterium]|nr:branched-chain amino acid ABC transporter permease [Acidimicrobiia bacterium]
MTAVLVDGFVLGLQFAILGVGLTLVYGLGGVVNLAHGQMAVLAAIVTTRLIDGGL